MKPILLAVSAALTNKVLPCVTVVSALREIPPVEPALIESEEAALLLDPIVTVAIPLA